MEVLVLALFSLSNIACFIIGARVGQKVTKGEEIKVTVNPMEAIREREAKKEAEYERSKFDTILRNIDSYDGSSYGQEDVPR